MTTESGDSASATQPAPAAATSAEPSTTTTTDSPILPAVEEASSWKLPVGIEDHLEAGVLKAAVGMTVGGLAGLLLFRGGGSGWRAASVATGLGVAVGSTYERAAATTRATSYHYNSSPPPVVASRVTKVKQEDDGKEP